MKVGIIGGGIAGLTAAWLLDQECEVVLCEATDTVGGHAATTHITRNGETVPIETGFEFFNETMFPHFWQLLKILNIPLASYPFTYTFFTPHTGNRIILPPIQQGKFFWDTLRQIPTLAQLQYTILKGRSLITNRDTQKSLDDFSQELWVTSSFKNDFFFLFSVLAGA